MWMFVYLLCCTISSCVMGSIDFGIDTWQWWVVCGCVIVSCVCGCGMGGQK